DHEIIRGPGAASEPRARLRAKVAERPPVGAEDVRPLAGDLLPCRVDPVVPGHQCAVDTVDRSDRLVAGLEVAPRVDERLGVLVNRLMALRYARAVRVPGMSLDGSS